MSENLNPITTPTDDTPSGFLGLTYGEIREWERKHAETCKRFHEQPCQCSAWD